MVKLLNNPDFASQVANINSATRNIDDYPVWNLSVFNLKKKKKILEIGCGTGWYFNTIMSLSPLLYVAADFSDFGLSEFSEKAANHRDIIEIYNVDITHYDEVEKLIHHQYDYILCFDVIEHIENDEIAIQNLYKLIKKTGGGLYIRVPALPFLYGENDISIGHFRRYTKKSLIEKLKKHGFIIEKIGYQNLPGIFFWFITGKLLKRIVVVKQSESRMINFAIPFISFFEKIIPPPLGLTIHCKCKV